MKRRDLVRKLEAAGFEIKQHGGKFESSFQTIDWYARRSAQGV